MKGLFEIYDKDGNLVRKGHNVINKAIKTKLLNYFQEQLTLANDDNGGLKQISMRLNKLILLPNQDVPRYDDNMPTNYYYIDLLDANSRTAHDFTNVQVEKDAQSFINLAFVLKIGEGSALKLEPSPSNSNENSDEDDSYASTSLSTLSINSIALSFKDDVNNDDKLFSRFSFDVIQLFQNSVYTLSYKVYL